MSMMKSPVEEKRIVSNTSVKKTSVTKNSYLFNHIDRLAADHDVTVSGTMIKVTYKKALKNNYKSSIFGNRLNLSRDSVLIESKMNSSNKPEVYNNKNRTTDFLNNSDTFNSEFNLVHSSLNSANMPKGENKNPIFHSTPKPDVDAIEKKKREYVNGLNLVVKINNSQVRDPTSNNHNHYKMHISSVTSFDKFLPTNNSNSKIVQKNTPKKSISENFQTNGIKFMKGVNLLKVKSSVISKNITKVNKKSELKKSTSNLEKIINTNNVAKSKKKSQEGIKKKIKNDDSGTSGKKLKKTDVNSQPVKRKISVKGFKTGVAEKKIKLQEKIPKEIKINRNDIKKKELLMEDPGLPFGWKRLVMTKYKDSPNEKHIVYILSPQGKKFQFKWKLRRYLEKTKSNLDIDQFHFGLYKRTKSRPRSKLYKIPKSENNEMKEGESSTLLKDSSNKPTSFSDKGDSLFSSSGKSSGKIVDPEGRQLLLFDPDLPFGWKRIINSRNSNGKLQVHIISPEGRIFRRRYRLHEYLTKHQYTHNLDRFYFGLYPKKESSNCGTDNSQNNPGVHNSENGRSIPCNHYDDYEDEDDDDDDDEDEFYEDEDDDSEILTPENEVSQILHDTPMYNDPKLPEGWKRYIRVRTQGESAGRMEVIILSPDGKRHRSKASLEHYFQQNNLNFKAEDFDFSVFGRNHKSSISSESKNSSSKKKSKSLILADKPVPSLDINSLKDVVLTPEGEMINKITGLMITCGLSTSRIERRLRLPKNQREKELKIHLDSESDFSSDGCDIPTSWIQKLVKCRSAFGVLEPDAAALIAEKTKEFLKELTTRAFNTSQHPEAGLRYEDVAELVDNSSCLSNLKMIIPKKITYKEFVLLNKPKQFMSFT